MPASSEAVRQNQQPQLDLLADPRSYGLPAGTKIERIDTYGAAVFLAGDFAYKLKRAVKFRVMDFSTLALRRAACAAEIAVNRRTAPQLYLGVAPIIRQAGALALGATREPGEREPPDAVDWVVVLRRFDPQMALDRLADRGLLEAGMIAQLADTIADFHAGAQLRNDQGGATRFAEAIATDIAEMRARGDALDQQLTDRLARAMPAELEQCAPIIERRRLAGCVRHCHGDLHLGNVVLIDGCALPFDAIEFNERIACIDTLYDLAFLLMDLLSRGRIEDANLALNRYLWRSPIASELDLAGLAAMPVMLARRAAIRAHVGAAGAPFLDDAGAAAAIEKARAYQRLAASVLVRAKPRLVAIGGLSGTGKTTLAMALAPQLDAAPAGAIVLRSDVIRKRLAGLAPTQRMPSGSYNAQASVRVYQELFRLAGVALQAGYSVVADAVFSQSDERQAIAAVAARHAVSFDGLWLQAPVEKLKARVAARLGDASDATAAVIARQEMLGAVAGDWRSVDAGGPPGDVAQSARSLIRIKGRGR